jgi:uncharacterized membrane protein YeaQ/YmgE (transglycosylase-associated protein family)
MILRTLLVGLIAGWLAGKLMSGGGYGMVADIVLGLIGAVIGQMLFNALGVRVYGGVSFLAMATIGAVILVGATHLIRRV